MFCLFCFKFFLHIPVYHTLDSRYLKLQGVSDNESPVYDKPEYANV